MLRYTLAVLYTALVLGANPAAADIAAADALRHGDMKKLAFHAEPVAIPQIGLLGMDDSARSLADYKGKWVILNFWATWCPPCRLEMPGLDQLQAQLGGADFVVVPVATGRNPPAAIEKFWAEAGIKNLQTLRDPKSELARAMGILGLPVTVILNPDGAEVGRLIGDAEWHSPEAVAMLTALLEKGE
jgi:thiol-disulfide isomerase/thioredoxin